MANAHLGYELNKVISFNYPSLRRLPSTDVEVLLRNVLVRKKTVFHAYSGLQYNLIQIDIVYVELLLIYSLVLFIDGSLLYTLGMNLVVDELYCSFLPFILFLHISLFYRITVFVRPGDCFQAF